MRSSVLSFTSYLLAHSSCTVGHNGTLLLQHGNEWEKENEGKSEKRLASTEVVEFADQEQDNSICILGDGNSSCGNDENDGKELCSSTCSFNITHTMLYHHSFVHHYIIFVTYTFPQNEGDGNVWDFQQDGEDPAPLSPTKENSGIKSKLLYDTDACTITTECM